jgi:hypothetical protein
MNAPVIAAIQFRSDQIMQLAIFLVPMLLFAIYKIISRCQRHKIKKLKIEKGIVSGRSKHHGGSVWIRSIYTGAGMLLASGTITWYMIRFQGGLEDNFEPFLILCLPFGCVGIGYLIRGILKRKSYMRKFALGNGIPFEVICPPQKQWILPLAIALPLLITVGLSPVYIYNHSNRFNLDMMLPKLVLVSGILGSILFIYSVLICIVARKNKANAVSVIENTIPTPSEPIPESYPEPYEDTDSFSITAE